VKPSLLTIFEGLSTSKHNSFGSTFEQRERLKKLLEKTKNQKDKLESLFRSLQAERKQKLKEKTAKLE